ncbi:inosine/xanthosine triphosphatase [Algoriphagus halophytocola]|uniref:Probable inosine/xanthosine triphosphatase n=1 Tax=Algoriphagus halophytocola TaxID=2991499 RepID=A0ABY6MCM4_9BACT|nr:MULTISPECIES: inosine/xanthosine triphosphatase [unclassified Algoriphagus]UZD21456.1 inosine/xanthosine triphosphatase [Algoriphagus sp. TR-M5]WBL42668.1 inosine/xanthosine triphosphatase [Algoriphagus sp. TR-M9]
MNFPKRENFRPTEKPLIIVGSKNPVKIACTEIAFAETFNRNYLVNGISAASQVPDQPHGDKETYLGAKNRVMNAKRTFPEADYWVGIEGGVADDDNGMYAFAWIYIEDKAGKHGKAKTGTFYLPQAVADLVHAGLELGKADDQFFSQHNSKQQGGSVGILTKGVLTRQSYYSQAIILALIPFINKEIY